jgi:hypothetical protein
MEPLPKERNHGWPRWPAGTATTRLNAAAPEGAESRRKGWARSSRSGSLNEVISQN